MFRIKLVLSQSDGKCVFRVGWFFRAVSAVAAAAVIAAGFALDTWNVPLVLALLLALAALYEESAVFDRDGDHVEFRLGLIFLFRRRAFALSEVVEVRVTTFGPASFTSLEVGLTDGRVLTIENDRGKPSTQRLTEWGQNLAQWLDVPLVQNPG